MAHTVNAEADALLDKEFTVLDHGFVRLVDYMGSDDSIVQAARVSYGKGTKKVSRDRELIRYLLGHRHTSPCEMVEFKFHIKLPIFVARQWIRHRTANVNEYSARYSILDREFYIPAPEDLAVQSVINNQGRGDTLTGEEAARVLESHDWPGNVRELANLIERMAILHPYGVVDTADLPEKFRAGEGEVSDSVVDALVGAPVTSDDLDPRLPRNGLNLKEHLSYLEISYIRQALADSGGVVAHAAKRLGMRRTTLVEKLRKYGLQRQT